MTVEAKSRMISFRVTEEEYDRFRDVCFTRGICSVSELAREAIHTLLEQKPVWPEALEARLADLEGQIRAVSHQLANLNQSVTGGLSATTEQFGARASSLR